MIDIYTDLSSIDSSIPVVELNDAYFISRIRGKVLDDIDKISMKMIDNAVYKEKDSMVGEFGETDIYKLSTGCKATINAHHLVKIGTKSVISVIECGDNAICRIMDIVNDTSVGLYMRHLGIMPERYAMERNYKFNVIKFNVVVQARAIHGYIH